VALRWIRPGDRQAGDVTSSAEDEDVAIKLRDKFRRR
jgi:hypothetical protein